METGPCSLYRKWRRRVCITLLSMESMGDQLLIALRFFSVFNEEFASAVISHCRALDHGHGCDPVPAVRVLWSAESEQLRCLRLYDEECTSIVSIRTDFRGGV